MPEPQTNEPPAPSQAPSIFSGLRVLAAKAGNALADTASVLSGSKTPLGNQLNTNIQDTLHNPRTRTDMLVGMVQPGGKGDIDLPEEFSGLRVKKAPAIVPEEFANRPMPETPQPSPQEIADLQAQNPSKLIRPEDVSKINRQQAAQKNVEAGLRGERGDEASQIREEHRAKLESSDNEQKSLSQKLTDEYGTTNAHKNAAFILSDGKMVPLVEDHDTMLRKTDARGTSKNPFVKSEGAIRVHQYAPVKGAAGQVNFEIPDKVTPEQVEQIKKIVNSYHGGKRGDIMLAKPFPEKEATREQFGTAASIDKMLRTLGAHPEGNSDPAIIKKGTKGLAEK